MFVELVTIVVDEYDPAIAFFVDVLGFDLVEDSPAVTNDGRPKRWVVVRPPGERTGLLLAQADGDDQRSVVGHQAQGASASSCAWTSSTPPTSGWRRPACSS